MRPLFPTILAVNLAGSLTAAWVNDQTNAAIDAGTFKSPSSAVRPRFRYWLPDASVDPEIVKADIKSAGSIGAGGIELNPLFQYGGQFGARPPGANWSSANFGTPLFQNILRASLEAHDENGLRMDFGIGPNQGQGVPASVEDEGLMWDLFPCTIPLGSSSTFDGIIPCWGIGDLVALVSAEVVSEWNQTFEAVLYLGLANVTVNDMVLKHGSLVDHAPSVSPTSGHLSLSLPASNGSSHYRLFAFYQYRTLHKNIDFEPTQDITIFDNGSYTVDHFSARGAATVTNFWEKYILDDNMKSLIAKVGNYAWEDSIEIMSNISWSPTMPARFEDLLNYKMEPFLPLMVYGQGGPTYPIPFRCALDTEDAGSGYISDFRFVLADGYREYLTALVEWSNDLNVQFSAQTVYGLQLDMLALEPAVNAPECETLYFNDNIDQYRLFSGPPNLAGKRVISNELGANFGEAYRLSVPHLLFEAHRALVGGANQFVVQGQSYTGNYYATTWPGYTSFDYYFSELYSNKQPSWENGFADAMEYLARTSFIQQTGRPKADIAIYEKKSATVVAQVHNWTDLIDAGWSYNYLSSDNFDLPEAVVENGLLAQSWQAVVVPASANLTMRALDHLSHYASQGLPVIFAGGAPSLYGTNNGSSEVDFGVKLATLKNQTNVVVLESGSIANALPQKGIRPRVAVKTNGTWYSTWRETSSTIYILVYSDVATSTGEIVVQSTMTPYHFDAWTGERSPLLHYQQDNATTTIPLSLKGNQTIIFAFSERLRSEIATPDFHIVSAPENVIGYRYEKSTGITLHTGASHTLGTVSLSTGAKIALNSTAVPESFQLTNWTLIAEHWEAPSNFSDASIIASKHNTTHQLARLVSWTEIPDLVNVSGVGYYTTTFSWPPSHFQPNPLGAYISFFSILHTIRVWVNGQRLAPLDLMNAVADISPYLKAGRNEVLAVVSTTMWNNLSPLVPKILNAGAPPRHLTFGRSEPIPFGGPVESGLVGEVVVTPVLVSTHAE